jgi:hypothetical protein
LVGGAITIALEDKPRDIGLIIGAVVLLNVGAIPLIVANQGQIRIMSVSLLMAYPTKVLVLIFILASLTA